MMRKLSFILISVIMIAFVFACVGGGGVDTRPAVTEIAGAGWNSDVATGDYTNSCGTLKLAADGSLEFVRVNGNMGAKGTWGSGKSNAFAMQFSTLFDTDGENSYEEKIRYDYGEGYVDGSILAPIAATGSGTSIEGTWTLPRIIRYDQSRGEGVFAAAVVDMTWSFAGGVLTITYNVYREFNEDSELPLYNGDGETEEIPYTVEGNVVTLDYEPVVEVMYAGGRLGDAAKIDFEIVEGKLLLYAFKK